MNSVGAASAVICDALIPLLRTGRCRWGGGAREERGWENGLACDAGATGSQHSSASLRMQRFRTENFGMVYRLNGSCNTSRLIRDG
jgi:hypothetical protein